MALEMRVPAVGESISEVTIGQWLKKDGDFVKKDEVICELESDKATFELNAEVSGTLRIMAAEGSTVPVGGLICRIEETATAPAAAEKTTTPPPTPSASGTAAAPVTPTTSHAAGHPSPAAAKILAEKGIAPSEVTGTGVGGRITKEDALHAQPQPMAQSNTATTTFAPTAQPNTTGERVQERKRMSSLRKTIARRLVTVKNETAMLTTFNELDMKPILDLRNKYKDHFQKKHGVKLGFMSFFVKACTYALQEFPNVNAQIEGDEIIYHNYCDVSIAVSTDKGLVVPVLRNAEQMTFAEIEKEIAHLADKARNGKLSIEEMQGGTFTITNGGVFGSMLSTPIINAPQTAILGMHNTVERPVVVDGQIVIRPIMYLALSYDHRLIDGKDSVSFLVRVKQLLEDPARMLLEV